MYDQVCEISLRLLQCDTHPQTLQYPLKVLSALARSEPIGTLIHRVVSVIGGNPVEAMSSFFQQLRQTYINHTNQSVKEHTMELMGVAICCLLHIETTQIDQILLSWVELLEESSDAEQALTQR